MYPDFKELLSAFNAEGVKYLVVGGYAVSFHARPRATQDLDILVEPSLDNAQALFRALARFGAPLEGLRAEDFADTGSFYRMGVPPLMIDILPRISGADFEAVWPRRIDVTIDAETGLKAPFIAAPDLIAAKLAAGRPQDLADVEALRRAAAAGGNRRAPPRRRRTRSPKKPAGR
jgi:hypothetical protein